ncbi:UNVERIFIED_CONTAM: hypothetical protein Q9R58_27955 [Methylobacteriaceae bacterium AG10]|nr:hypothetical protein [Methylobacteriaceae bacterium AG10]
MRKHYPLNAAGAEDAGLLPWTDGVPATGVEGSYPGHALITDTEAEVLAATAAAGLIASGTDLTQLAQAISRGIYVGGFTGSANALAASLPNSVAFPSLLPGMRFQGIALATNTGAVTLALSGFATPPGTLNLLRRDGLALRPGDVPVGMPFSFVYDGAAYRMAVPARSEIKESAPVYQGANTGTVDAIVADLTPSPTAYELGALYLVSLSGPNTGAVTANFEALGVKNVVRSNGNPLRAGDISRVAVLTYDGTNLVLINLAQEIAPPGSAFAGGQNKFAFQATQGVPSVLQASFTIRYAGVVTAFSTLNSSPQNGNIQNTASISVNGTPQSGGTDTIVGASNSIINVDVRPGDVVLVTSTVIPADQPPANVSQYLRYQFAPG